MYKMYNMALYKASVMLTQYAIVSVSGCCVFYGREFRSVQIVRRTFPSIQTNLNGLVERRESL